MASPVGENSYILRQSQMELKEKKTTDSTENGNPPPTMSDFSETSSMGDLRQLVDEGNRQEKTLSSIPMTSFNFINSIIGSGMIGIPFALKQAGFGLGILLLMLVAVITDFSVLFLIEAGKLSNTDNYQDMVLVTCGRYGFFLLTLLQFLYPLIAMISYNVIIGDTITKVVLRLGGEERLGSTVLANRQFIIFLATVMVTLPLSLYRDVAKLGKWAFLSLVMVIFILICICIRLGDFADNIQPTEGAWRFADADFAQAIGIMAFAYMCHHNTFLIHGSLENPTNQRWSFVTHLSIIFSMTILLLIGIIGYVSFTGFTQGDLMENYCHQDDLMNIARFAFAITIMLTYPVECFVTREVIGNALYPTNDPHPLWRHILTTAIICTIAMGISMLTDCLGIVFTINGVLVACPLAFIIPPVCVMRLRQEPLLSRGNVAPMLVCFFGILVMVIGTIMTIREFGDGFKCSHGKNMEYCLSPQIPGSIDRNSTNSTFS